MIADIQHLGRTIVIGKPGGEPMPFSCRVESTTTDHRHTEWMCHPLELRHHAGGFAIHNKSCLLPCAVVKCEVGRHLANSAHELLRAVPADGRGADAAIIADRRHRNDAGTACAIEVLAQSPVGALGLFVIVGTNQAVENLPDREWQIVLVLVEHATHLLKQLQRRSSWSPRSEAAHARSHSAGTTQKSSGVCVIGDAHEFFPCQSPRS